MSQTQVPTRAEIADRYKWNDVSVFATVEDWSAEMAALNADLANVVAWRGRLGESPATLLEAMAAIEAYYERVGKAAVYAFLGESVNTADQAATARAAQAGSLYGRVGGALSFLEPELLAIGREKLATWEKENAKLAVYHQYFDNLFRRQAHVRSEEVEEILGMASDAFSGPRSTFSKLTDTDFKFRPATDKNGAAVEFTQGTLDDLLHSPDREVRRSAWENYHDQYLAYKSTLTNNLMSSIKQNVLVSRVRRHESSLEMALFENAVPTEVYHNLLDTFRRNMGVWQRYMDVRRRALGLSSLHTYDIWAPLTKGTVKVPYEQAVEWIYQALRPLGEEYAQTLRRGCLDERWIDVYPNQGKTAGAFSWGARGTHPFIVMSYTDDALSMGTLAHELGHSMHSYLSWKTQPPIYGDYSLFAAEVASNFNQAMMRGYMLQQDIDPQLKIAVIEEAMSNFHRYFLEMPTLAIFELDMFQRVERGEGLTPDMAIDTLADLFAAAYGDKAVVDRQRDGIRWATFSHLYMNYYVYQYATGISGANALARRVLSGQPGAAADYLGFLSAGSSRYPLDALKSAGVDLSTPAPVEAAFDVLRGLIDQLDKLTNG